MRNRLGLITAIGGFALSALIINALTIFLYNKKSENNLIQTDDSLVYSSDLWAQKSSPYINAVGQTIVYFQPDGYPAIISNTESLEVTGLAKSPSGYKLLLKNISHKNIVAYYLSVGHHEAEIKQKGYGHEQKLIAANETFQEELLQERYAKFDTLTIQSVIFDDDSFEGDINLAVKVIARRLGIRIQALPVLKMIDRTLEVDDANLLQAVDEFGTQLAVMPEAISKPNALELLKSKYPYFDRIMIATLYENLKQGLYEGKNRVHCPLGNELRYIKEREDDSIALKVELIREKLQEIKENLSRFSEIP